MPTPEEIIARRARRRAQLRRRRIVAIAILVATVVVAGICGVRAIERMGREGSSAAAGVAAKSASPTPSSDAQEASPVAASASPTATSASPSSSPTTEAYAVGGPAPRPKIVEDYIDFDAQRQAEMSKYSRDHYGQSGVRLNPKVIVVHYTCGSDYASAHATFASDAANMGVKPGVVAHFVIDKDGTIYQQLPLRYKGRHTVGLNYVAYGIECVDEGTGGDSQTTSRILHRRRQERSLVALVRWLMYRDHIKLANVIGHGMANDSPYFKDLAGWTNDHTDWSSASIRRLRAGVRTDE